MYLSELKALHVSQLIEMALALDIENANRMRKQELMFTILKRKAKGGEQIFGDGVLEVLPDGFGFLRTPETSYLASPDDIYISPSQIRRFNLHTGDSIEGEVRTPKDGERYFALVKVDRINGEPPEEPATRPGVDPSRTGRVGPSQPRTSGRCRSGADKRGGTAGFGSSSRCRDGCRATSSTSERENHPCPTHSCRSP